MSELSLLEKETQEQVSMKLNKKWAWIALLLCLSCSSIPQPCDPEFLASQQMITAAACRSKAESTCPGYSKMTEDQKIECPGVLECLEKIEKAEDDCHGS